MRRDAEPAETRSDTDASVQRILAAVAGVLLPVVETMRRWHQLGDIRVAPAWLDDYLICAFLLYMACGARAIALETDAASCRT